MTVSITIDDVFIYIIPYPATVTYGLLSAALGRGLRLVDDGELGECRGDKTDGAKYSSLGEVDAEKDSEGGMDCVDVRSVCRCLMVVVLGYIL